MGRQKRLRAVRGGLNGVVVAGRRGGGGRADGQGRRGNI